MLVITDYKIEDAEAKRAIKDLSERTQNKLIGLEGRLNQVIKNHQKLEKIVKDCCKNHPDHEKQDGE